MGRRAHFGALFTSALYAQLEEKRGSWRSTLAVNRVFPLTLDVVEGSEDFFLLDLLH